MTPNAQKDVSNAAVAIVVVVVVVLSPQTPEGDLEKRLCMHLETCKFVDGRLPKIQSPAFRVEGGAAEPQVVVCLIFIIVYPACSFFRSVDQMLPTAKSKMMFATEASHMSHVRLGHLEVFSKNEVCWLSGGVERRGDERSRAGAPNNASAGGEV